MLSSINLSDPQIIAHIKTIGYPAMFLLMVIEGPIITIISAFLASLGFFNIFSVFFLSFSGDMVGDVILYSIGYYGGNKALKKAEKILGITPKIISKLEKLFSEHGRKTIMAVKSTTGLCWITFILAGTTRMKFNDFLFGSFWGGIVWSGFLVIMGYFFGYAFGQIGTYIKYAGLIIFFGTLTFYILLVSYKKRRSNAILRE